ncbi:MAG: aminoglycoside phosphotransferase family protein [Firmicutes bacterium]|nr:aminoglycoside phosphotransferase family protein [Bacillota bacterium]
MSIFTQEVTDAAEMNKLSDIFFCISGVSPEILVSDWETPCFAERFCDKEYDYDRKYDVYKITCGNGAFVLKKTDENEVSVYRRLNGRGLNVPLYYGCRECSDGVWILIEYIEGDDLRIFDEASAYAAAVSLVGVMNEFAGLEDDCERFSRYMKRIKKRSLCLRGEDMLVSAYDIFLNRQLTIKRTMQNGDLLQFNAIKRSGKVYIIDWGFGGFMPYSLDIARMTAHGIETPDVGFPFLMNERDRRAFIDEVYRGLAEKPSRDEYERDVLLSTLNEYVEFAEPYLENPGEERGELFELYYEYAVRTAREILQ